MGRNLIPTEVPHLEDAHFHLPEPLKVSFGAIALPHPEKIADGGPKAVNRKWEGWGGEDAYFCTDERLALSKKLIQHVSHGGYKVVHHYKAPQIEIYNILTRSYRVDVLGVQACSITYPHCRMTSSAAAFLEQ